MMITLNHMKTPTSTYFDLTVFKQSLTIIHSHSHNAVCSICHVILLLYSFIAAIVLPK